MTFKLRAGFTWSLTKVKAEATEPRGAPLSLSLQGSHDPRRAAHSKALNMEGPLGEMGGRGRHGWIASSTQWT